MISTNDLSESPTIKSLSSTFCATIWNFGILQRHNTNCCCIPLICMCGMVWCGCAYKTHLRQTASRTVARFVLHFQKTSQICVLYDVEYIFFFAYSLIYLLCGRLFGVIFVTYSKSSIDFYLPFKNIQYWNSWNLPLFPFHHFRRTISWNFQFYVQFCIVAARIQRSFFFSFFLLCIANVSVLVSMCFSISFSVGCLYFIHICLVVDLNKKHAHFSLVALLDFALSLCVCMLNM